MSPHPLLDGVEHLRARVQHAVVLAHGVVEAVGQRALQLRQVRGAPPGGRRLGHGRERQQREGGGQQRGGVARRAAQRRQSAQRQRARPHAQRAQAGARRAALAGAPVPQRPARRARHAQPHHLRTRTSIPSLN